MNFRLLRATPVSLDTVDALVSAYHAFEGISLAQEVRRQGIMALLTGDEFGALWLIENDNETIGYIAVCFGYSIEFAGRDAFVDEFFIGEGYRGQGYGGAVLEQVAAHLAELGIAALHLEVARSNARAQRLYTAAGFEARDKYQLMTRRLN